MKGLYMYVNTGRKTGCLKSNSHTSLLPFFSDKILLIRKNLSLFVQGTMSTIIT